MQSLSFFTLLWKTATAKVEGPVPCRHAAEKITYFLWGYMSTPPPPLRSAFRLSQSSQVSRCIQKCKTLFTLAAFFWRFSACKAFGKSLSCNPCVKALRCAGRASQKKHCEQLLCDAVGVLPMVLTLFRPPGGVKSVPASGREALQKLQ